MSGNWVSKPVLLTLIVGSIALVAIVTATLSWGEGRRTVRWENHSVDVPADWPQRNLSQWCRSSGETPTWSIPAPTTFVECNPSIGHGAAFVPSRESMELQQVDGEEFPEGAWVAVRNFPDMSAWSLLIVGRDRDEAVALLESAQ